MNDILARAYLEYDTQYSKMSGPEKAFNNEGYLLLKDFVSADVNIKVLLYEPITFHIPGGKYTPDFLVLFTDGTLAFIEVKQVSVSRSGRKYYGKSYRDSRSKLRATASLHPWFQFYQASYSRTGWTIEHIRSDI